MAQRSKSQQKRMIFITAGVIFALLLIVALIANLVILANKNKRIEQLNAQIAQYNEVIHSNEAELARLQSPRYIADFAMSLLFSKKFNRIIILYETKM